jgi:hypothetical protein
MHDIYSLALTDDDFEAVDETITLPNWLAAQYEQRAAAERDSGSMCSVNHYIPAIFVQMANGETWHFQEHEAQEILNAVPDNLSPEDYVLASAQNW